MKLRHASSHQNVTGRPDAVFARLQKAHGPIQAKRTPAGCVAYISVEWFPRISGAADHGLPAVVHATSRLKPLDARIGDRLTLGVDHQDANVVGCRVRGLFYFARRGCTLNGQELLALGRSILYYGRAD